MGFTTLLSSQVISVAFYSEREKSDKFCSEPLILAWGSFTCRKSTIRNPQHYFPSEVSHTQDFYALKKIHRPPTGFEPANLGSSGEYDNNGTTGVDCFGTVSLHPVNMQQVIQGQWNNFFDLLGFSTSVIIAIITGAIGEKNISSYWE